jgi:hypothetical protein
VTAIRLMSGSAWLSPDRRYRFSFSRQWGDEGDMAGVCCFVLLNPSTADATRGDPTLRRCVGFARRWRYLGLVIVNLFALRTPDPRELVTADDPIGHGNDEAIRAAARRAALVVIGWGSGGQYQGRGAHVRQLLLEDGIQLRQLGVTGAGEPRHPLYIRADQELVSV